MCAPPTFIFLYLFISSVVLRCTKNNKDLSILGGKSLEHLIDVNSCRCCWVYPAAARSGACRPSWVGPSRQGSHSQSKSNTQRAGMPCLPQSYIRHKDICPSPSFSVTLRTPPLKSETGWTGEHWSKTNLLNWQN